ncbi:adenine deaminase [Clostridium carboxidivorans P7]|uniref:Adenine deaminase n=1 Tax=Clostridium carboxidivorans P7 TaxID=536227 RepID=C6PTI9_9CLOT|nr:adenine deaminase [Clostridium carboxidivorans]AKN31792.1 adenine deaminase [Clostridium carboxidivorans P7]EET87419.1 adenine deaminase [Clostridium carboxidivorans P7]EFG87377.1 adenine deaminase [Clostridium carboxidivorans P7]
MNKLLDKINAAMGKVKAELVLKDAFIINVFTQTIEKKDVAINDDVIVGIGKYEGNQEIDCKGLFVAPGFIDSHVHIESSMVTPEIFSDLVIKKGVTTIVADPHEIANVLGEKGIEFMLENSKKGDIDTFFMLPSCVPAVDFEDNGAVLEADNLEKFINHPKVLGLGEVMDVNSVTSGNKNMLKKILMANNQNKSIDGHCPKINEKELNAYLCANVKTDHECTNYEEALQKVANGMYVMLREGSAARDLKKLLPAVNDKNYGRFIFCTDDRHIEDLVDEGSIDNCIRIAIDEGMDPVKAYTIASFNAANCYGLKDRGAISPGMKADLVIFEDIKKLKIKNVIKNGKIYKDNHIYEDIFIKPSVNVDCIKEDLFHIEAKGKFVNVIKVHPGLLVTKKEKREVKVNRGLVQCVEGKGEIVNKIAVIERHKNTGKHCVGFIEGLGLKKAAIAQTIAHDSHNIIVLGDNDKDMEIAVNNIIHNNGGIAFVSQGKLLECLELPIGGLMTSQNPGLVMDKITKLNLLAVKFGIKKEVDPFLTLAFMALPVIPDIKITSRGLFDYSKFDFIDLFTDV